MAHKHYPASLRMLTLLVLFLLSSVSLPSPALAQGGCSESALLGLGAGGSATLPDPSCTVTLTQPIIISTGSASITGNGARISGNDLVRVIEVKEGASLTLTDVTLQDGRASEGGGLYNAGTAALDGVTVSSNYADSFGGGIYNRGTMTIRNSSIAVNVLSPGGSGGGVVNAVLDTATPGQVASVDIFNTTIFGNNAANLGGGVYNDRGQMTIRNSTIVGNNAFNNGGGIFNTNQGTVSLYNSITAGNTAAATPDCASLEGSVTTSRGYNLVGQNNNANGCPSSGLGDLVLENGIDTVVNLIAQINGSGPATLSFVAGSPALNTGDPNFNDAAEPTDQRGLPRKVNDRIDIGAFEAQIPLGQDDLFDVPFNEIFTAPGVGVLNNDSDPDSDSLRIALVDPTKFGSLFLNPDGTFTYRPRRNFRGDDVFVYSVTDGNYTVNRIARLRILRNRTGCDPTEQVEVDSLSVENPQTLLYFPRGTLSGCVGNPSYQWPDVGSAVYNIYLSQISPSTTIMTPIWLELNAAEVCGEGNCIVDLTDYTPNAWLLNGSYGVWMCPGTRLECESPEPWYDAGGETTFNINTPVVEGVTMPTTIDATTRTPILTWSVEGTAENLSWFHVYLAPTDDPFAFIINEFYSRQAVCRKGTLFAWNGTDCALQVATPLEEGREYMMYIKGWGPSGLTTGGLEGWAGPTTFVVSYVP
ncbi:MAG: hypothetical protein OHK0046_18090 [Anaerolineae bacterium]